MYWSGYDSCILVTGILTLVLATLPGIRVAGATRAGIAGVGAILVIMSIVTGNIQVLVYPSVVTIAPVVPVIVTVVMIVRGRSEAATEARMIEVGVEHRVVTPAPAIPTASPGGHRVGFLDTQAADPATPRQKLADIAFDHPKLRSLVAANPSAYPDLLAWLGELGDPAVDAALARRVDGPSHG